MYRENITNEITGKAETSEKIEVKNFIEGLNYQPDSTIIKMILKKSQGNVVLFAFDKDQGLIEHSASSEALVYIIEGEIEFKIAGESYVLKQGDSLILPAKIPHSLFAINRTKMLLVIISN